MGSKSNSASLALFFLLNLLFFAFASAQCAPPPPPPPTPSPPPPPPPPTPSPSTGTCPINALKLGVCANLLNGLLNITIGTPPVKPCCSLFPGLVDLEVALCLCTVIKANPLVPNVHVALSLLVNVCGRNIPTNFQCP
ncbi:14 kDa proline-rich protein DC2.15-like [Camellia sinensis]|uniref:14 kDa proline-rich protein DC2.15-like n=1 Tax=Camellia sinensis TaxID=4442 RepID=UPI001036EB8D|nr:14 kDa proline-rich protein DC2.15-like [Camellia sinensis]